MTNRSSASPFSHILITAPREEISDVYLTLCLSIKRSVPSLRDVVFLCVADPAGYRIGSGGGTLNALHYLQQKCGIHEIARARVAIIHSGGDSRRAPLHSVCGKAWASINSTQSDCLLSAPLALMIVELNAFCCGLQPGSVVVASSDVLLDIARVSNLSHLNLCYLNLILT